MDLPFLKKQVCRGDALFSQVLVGVVNAVTTVIAVFIIDKVGRKKLVYYGVSGMILSLLLIGFYFSFAETLNLPNNFLLFFFCFMFLLCYFYLCSHFCTAFGNVSYPYSWDGNVSSRMFLMGRYLSCRTTDTMDASESYPAGTFLLFAVMCIPYLLIVWKLIPETTGKSLEEIERYWMKNNRPYKNMNYGL